MDIICQLHQFRLFRDVKQILLASAVNCVVSLLGEDCPSHSISVYCASKVDSFSWTGV